MLFKEAEIEQRYLEEGFVILPLLEGKEFTQLKALFEKNYSMPFTGLQPLLRLGDAKKNIELHYEIGKILTPVLEKWFLPFAFNANHFIAKGANDPNEFRLHQDWNVVDETKFIAAHIWIALQDIDEKNGGLFIVKGSHKFFKNKRSGSCGITFIDRTEKIKQHITNLKIKEGEAVVYQQALFHGSHPNSDNRARLVCLSSLRPQIAPMEYFHKPHPTKPNLEVYEITPEILFEQINFLEKGISPNGREKIKILSLSDFDEPVISNNVFEQKL